MTERRGECLYFVVDSFLPTTFLTLCVVFSSKYTLTQGQFQGPSTWPGRSITSYICSCHFPSQNVCLFVCFSFASHWTKLFTRQCFMVVWQIGLVSGLSDLGPTLSDTGPLLVTTSPAVKVMWNLAPVTWKSRQRLPHSSRSLRKASKSSVPAFTMFSLVAVEILIML